MSANKKRRRLPEEDLAATVADIISSPITRSNLSFLRPFPTPAANSHEPEPTSSEPPELDIERKGAGTEPPDTGPKPPGLGSSPPSTTPSAPHSWQPVAPTRALWQAEGLGTFFEQTRVRRIHQAQDALSLVEEKVYDLLWGPKNLRKDEFRLVHYSLQRIATEARVNIKTVRELIPRLIDKGFIAIEHEADVRRNIPTLYRVLSYTSVLNDQKRRNRFYVAKTGKGVFYVHPVSATVQAASEPMGSEQNPCGFKPMGASSSPAGHSTAPEGPPMEGMGGLKPMESSGPSLDTLIDNFLRQTTTTTYAAITESIRQTLNLEPDDTLLRNMIYACHQNAFNTLQSPATDEELIYFTATKARILSRTPNIRNHLAVLRKAVPECFLGETFRAYRMASAASKLRAVQEKEQLEREAAETEARHNLWTTISERHKGERGYDMLAISKDPELDDLGRKRAQGMLELLGRFTRSGI
jgi:predicted transcriptional regulator